MTTAISHQAIGTKQVHKFNNDSGSCNGYRNFSMGFISKGFRVNMGLLRRDNSIQFKCVTKASASHSSEVDPISPSPENTTEDSDESALILIRHGESMWNEKNLFTGMVDVPLTKKGIEEAIEAGKRISNIPVDIIYTSALIRAQMTAMLALTQLRCKKVPIIMHNESEQAEVWSQIYSEDTMKLSIPVVTAWQLNERMYGELQGLNKQEIAERYGKKQVHEWRRSYGVSPPNGESLEICSQRAVAYFREHIEPQLFSGKHVLVAAHANSLRSIIVYLDKLTSQEVISLELSNGIPMLYIYKEGKFIRRGSPVGSKEAGVYAYSRLPIFEAERLSYSNPVPLLLKSLAFYRQKLDGMSD